jgi:hypothetical protein
MRITDKEYIFEFLANKRPDYKGRLHSDIIAFTDERLEMCHDQIQWLFPLHEESNYADTYPILTKESVEYCLANGNLMDEEYPECVVRNDVMSNMQTATHRMRRFYKLNDYGDDHTWCVDGDHNLLRITRIIRSLRLFHSASPEYGLYETINRFYMEAMSIATNAGISPVTLGYWSKAMFCPVWDSLR